MSNNKINVIDEITLCRLKNLELQTINYTNVENAGIQMSGNPIGCVCDNRQYIFWVLTRNRTASCILDEKEMQIDECSLRQVDFHCKETIVVVVYSILTVTEVILTSLFVCLVIRERKADVHRKRIRLGIKQYNRNRKDKRNPPVFLSFCSEDDEIVMRECAPKLEEGLKKLLQTDFKCVATGYNDFRPGFSLANEIIRCVEDSSVVFFVTNTFCKKKWCRNEALVAHYENKPIILMMWEKLDLKIMPKYMFHHYQEHARVHWIHENGQLAMKPDWNTLCEAIVSLFRE